MDILPVTASADADFPALLRLAFELEDQCEESPPGTTPLAALTAGSSTALAAEPPAAQSRQHKKRRRERNTEILALGYRPSTKTVRKQLKGAQLPVKTGLNTISLPVAGGAYTALNKPTPQNPSEIPEIAKLVQSGFQYISCGENGIPSRHPRPICDRNGLIIAHIAGAPDDSTYDKQMEELFRIIVEESRSRTFTKGDSYHKRGNFPAVNFGFTLPNGFKHPINLDYQRHQEKIDRIRSCPGFVRMSAFQNAAFALWNPGVYEYQKQRVEQLLSHDKELKRTTPKTIFPTTACNFRNVCCYKHRDTQNCPFGWCAITALGNFDHTLGGHLILWELKLVIEFPHGYTVFIPSATITHSNTPVIDGDVRVSITQYCAGSIFRYVDNGFCTDKALFEEDKRCHEENQVLKDHRWKMSLDLLSTTQDLKNRKHLAVPLL